MPLGQGRGQNFGLRDFAIFGLCCRRGHLCFTNTCLVVFMHCICGKSYTCSMLCSTYNLKGRETANNQFMSNLFDIYINNKVK